ncbi:MAG: SDR family oxidoreductase [Ignavibacteria bacterium]|nr:SDR family oxidoreductase [Ignavibacteria bacterium]
MISELFSLKDRVAVVTGAAGLLGRMHCEALAGAGADVIVTDLKEDECDKLASELSSKFGRRCSGKFCDVTSVDSLGSLKHFIENSYGRLDILVNNAALNDSVENSSGSPEHLRFENYPYELWMRSLNVNLTGVFLCSQILGQFMLKNKKGNIINIASTYGIVAPDQSIYLKPDGERKFYKSPVYPVSKAAVIMFTKYLASYWGKENIRVNSLSPGGVENFQEDFFIKNYSMKTPLGRMSYPNEYIGALIFLASDASSYMTGANLVIDGGWSIW